MKKRIIRLIFIFVIASSLFAYDLYYKCEYPGVPFRATGTYICNDLGEIMYINPMTGSEIDLLEESPFLESYENLKITKNFVHRNIYDIYGNNFCDFDENGNFYFAGSLSYTTLDYGNYNPDYIVATDVVFIYKFNPVNLSLLI